MSMPNSITLTIVSLGKDGVIPPRTKKNHSQIVGREHPRLLPSKEYREWHKGALSALIGEGRCRRESVIVERRVNGRITRKAKIVHRWNGSAAIDYPVNVQALFYRDRNVGDACGFYQAIADFLQDAGLFADDRFIVQWDGSRLLKDAANPRVEITITPLGMRESETSLHREYEGKRATGEWFALSREDVSKIRITLGGDKSITDTGDSKGDNKYHPALRAYDSDSISGLGVQGEGVDDIVERVIALHPNKTYPDYARHAFVELIETAADPTAEARKIEAAHKLWVRYWRDHFDDERFVPKLHEFLRGGTWKNSPPNISRNSSQPHPAFIRSAL